MQYKLFQHTARALPSLWDTCSHSLLWTSTNTYVTSWGAGSHSSSLLFQVIFWLDELPETVQQSCMSLGAATKEGVIMYYCRWEVRKRWDWCITWHGAYPESWLKEKAVAVMNLRGFLSHRVAWSQPQWLPSWTSPQKFRKGSIRLWRDGQIRVPDWACTWQAVATPGIYKDNSNCQKLTATHRSPPSKHETAETTFGP